MDAGTIVALALSGASAAGTCLAVYFGRIQANAARIQADAARVQADAAKVQAEAAIESIRNSTAWRDEDEARSKPNFGVNATPVIGYIWDSGDVTSEGGIPEKSEILIEVQVRVANMSSRAHPIHHGGISFLSDSGAVILRAKEMGLPELPYRLEAGHQFSFVLKGDRFGVSKTRDDCEDGKRDFQIFVTSSGLFEESTDGDTWRSTVFSA